MSHKPITMGFPTAVIYNVVRTTDYSTETVSHISVRCSNVVVLYCFECFAIYL